MINKKELTLWGISAAIAFALLFLVLILSAVRRNNPQNCQRRMMAAGQAMTPQALPRAQIAAQQNKMSGSIFRVEPSVVCVCTTGADVAGKGVRLCEVGTGVIISANGFVLTTDQVTLGERDIKVVIYEHSGLDGPSFEIGHNHIFDADIVSSFPAAGFAVLKIDAASLPVARLGESNAVAQGDWCLAIGSGFGQKPTVTSGMITGINRVARINGHAYRNIIETSCKWKHYFNGGPLINDEGEVIGIIIDRGYAVSSDRIIPVLSSLAIPVF